MSEKEEDIQELKRLLGDDVGITTDREARKCQLCGSFKETRPYGPNGEHVCFQCGMKNEGAAQRQFKRVVFGKVIN